MIINVPSEWWEEVEAGEKASKQAGLTGKAVENPYHEDDTRHDYWHLGFMAAEHGWDVEY